MIINLLIFLISFIVSLYITYKISNCKINIIKTIVFLMIFSLIIELFNYYDINKIYINILYLIFQTLFIKLSTNLKIDKSIILSLISYILNAISEILLTTILIMVLKSTKVYNIYGIIIPIISIIFVNLKVLQNTFRKIINDIKNTIYLLFFVFIYLLYCLINAIYIKNYSFILIISCFTLIILILLIKIIIDNQKMNSFKEEYESTLKIIDEYNIVLNERIKMTHEFKNQLIIIKSMIKDSDKNTNKYINELLNEPVSNINTKLASELQKCPFKVLNGLMYYKLSIAKEKNIKVNLEIDKNISKFKKTKESDITDICKIMSIYLDNSINACLNSEKEISVSLYKDEDKFIISIANTFDGLVNNIKKDNNKLHIHGHGLSIAKDILKNNKKLHNKTRYLGNIYIQEIIYKKE